MKRATLVHRSLRFYWRTHLGVLAGCAISAAVLAGALFVGDSVRHSLRRIALARLGQIDVALDAGRRFFRDDLAQRVGVNASAVLRVEGMAIAGDNDERRQVNRLSVLGIDAAFFGLANAPPGVTLGRGQVAINRWLADALRVSVGDEVSLRLVIPDLLSRDAPLASGRERDTARRRVEVAAILDDGSLGRFSLRSDQTAPMNAFVDRASLQKILELDDRANLLVAAGTTVDDARAALRKHWALDDAGLAVRSTGGLVQLESPRIYVDPAVATVALDVDGATGALTYLVNSITAKNGRATPYSFVVGISPGDERRLGPVPRGMRDDEILVNRWLADQLALTPGDTVTVAYAELTPTNEFIERTRDFRVHSIVEMAALASERELVPEFPGLTDVESCSDWDVGITTDAKKLEDKPNEAYWKKYRETPKAFVTLAAGRAMWTNRYGDLMAIRYPASRVDATKLSQTILERVDPAATGLAVRPVRAEAMRAAAESMDLGQLFLGMSFFLIVASLILTAMLFVFSVDQRARERGVLLAVGHTHGMVRRLMLFEGVLVALAGSIIGVPLGWAFAKTLIWGLQNAWSGAVAGTAIGFHATATSAAIAVVAGTGISLFAMAVAMWRHGKRPVRALIAGEVALDAPGPMGNVGWLALAFFVGGTAGAVAIAGWTLLSGAARPADGFFAAGGLMLIGGIAFVRILLARSASSHETALSVRGLGVRNAGRRPGRGVATAGILAAGSFIVLAVAAMKEDFAGQTDERRSGSGGFELYGESSVAVHDDLNTDDGRTAFRLRDNDMRGVSIVPLRVLDGDDASCLNLNQSLTPPLLGIDPAEFERLGAFTGPDDASETWKLLGRERADGAVPAIIGDSATAMWKLKKSVGPESGAVLRYTDERGRAFDVKLVGALPMRLSVLQGRLLIANKHFTEHYPSEGGHRAFLVDAPAARTADVQRYLTRRLERVGLDLVPTVDRLKQFYVVESTYLMMFLVLGGLGLLLGTTGMGVLVLRNVLERRSELALLRAVGYSPRAAGHVVMAEHRFLLIAGLAVGAIAAAVALLPSLTRPDVQVPYPLLAGFLVVTAALSLGWIWLAARLALRGELVPALRDE